MLVKKDKLEKEVEALDSLEDRLIKASSQEILKHKVVDGDV